MNHSIRYIVLLFVCFSAFARHAYSQEFTDKKRAEYILYIAQKINWPKDLPHEKFSIGIMGEESQLIDSLKILADRKGQVHGRPLVIKQINDISQLTGNQVIFAHKRSGYNIEEIYENTKGTFSLIISENYEFQSSMIGLVMVDEKHRFTVNEKMLADEGLTASPLFLALAIKTRQQWEAEFKKSLERLEEEIEKVKAHRRKIHAQRAQIDSQDVLIRKQLRQLASLNTDIEEKKQILNAKLDQLAEQESRINDQRRILVEQKSSIKEQEDLLNDQQSKISNQLAQIKLQRVVLILFLVFIFLVIILAYYIYTAYKIKKETNKKLEEKNIAIQLQNEEIRQQKEEIEAQRDEIEEQRDYVVQQNTEIKQKSDQITKQNNEISKQRDKLAEQNREILDSITYARRIQSAVMPPMEAWQGLISDFFILNLPRDIVSGDYYWFKEHENKLIFTAADCTGHGVPGAFMSMLGVSFLNEIMTRVDKNVTAAEILNELRSLVISSLHQQKNTAGAKDGMDIALVVYDKEKQEIQFAGANNPLYIIRQSEAQVFEETSDVRISKYVSDDEKTYQLLQIKADKMPISIHVRMMPFTNHVVECKSGDAIYLFSDGYIDQFGAKTGRKFMSKNFKNLLLRIQHQPMQEQQKTLKTEMDNWQQDEPQLDDILVLGVRL